MTASQILAYAAREQAMFTDMELNNFGYHTRTTSWSDLSIAECFGPDSVTKTYNKLVRAFGHSYKDFTELVICLNHKCWEHHERKHHNLSALYSELYYKAKDAFYTKFADNAEAQEYFFETTD